MTIEKQPQAIICDYCGNADYYYGDKREVWRQARKMGWLIYQGKHFDDVTCLDNYKSQKELHIEDLYKENNNEY